YEHRDKSGARPQIADERLKFGGCTCGVGTRHAQTLDRRSYILSQCTFVQKLPYYSTTGTDSLGYSTQVLGYNARIFPDILGKLEDILSIRWRKCLQCILPGNHPTG